MLYQESFPVWSATGRIVGETAALIYTAGAVAKVPSSLMGSAEPWQFICMYFPVRDFIWIRPMPTAVILLVFVLVLNWISGFCAKRLSKAANGQ